MVTCITIQIDGRNFQIDGRNFQIDGRNLPQRERSTGGRAFSNKSNKTKRGCALGRLPLYFAPTELLNPRGASIASVGSH